MPLCAAVIQMCARQDIEQNLSVARALVDRAAARGAQLAVLPENFAYIGKLEHKVQLAEPLSESEPGPILRAMQEAARSTGLHLLLGGTPIRSDHGDRFYNTAVLLDPRGHILASYRKIHLFDINIPGVVFTESERVMPGEEPVVADLLGARLGFSICYDLRFPELYRELSRRGATLLAVPAAFTLHTGKDHWLPLLRARAIENQCYVLAAGQHGAHTETRTSYGKSCIIDPWGAVIAQVSDGDGVAVAMLDFVYLEKVRRELPALTHRRI
jgi:deaminated glutathione amidase